MRPCPAEERGMPRALENWRRCCRCVYVICRHQGGGVDGTGKRRSDCADGTCRLGPMCCPVPRGEEPKTHSIAIEATFTTAVAGTAIHLGVMPTPPPPRARPCAKPPSPCTLDPPPPPPRQVDARGSADARSSAEACLSWQKVQGREANGRRHRLTEPTPKALCQNPLPLHSGSPPPPPGRWMPAAVRMPAVVRRPACHSRRFKGERPIGAATG